MRVYQSKKKGLYIPVLLLILMRVFGDISAVRNV